MSRRVDRDVFAYGFDLLALDGEDLRPQPLEQRRTKLTKLLARSKDGIVLSEHMDGELGQVMFKHACRMGLEGVVSKRRDRPYVAGRSTMWLKIQNPRARQRGVSRREAGSHSRQ